MATQVATTVKTKRLASSILSTDLSFTLNNILSWKGEVDRGTNLTSADFGTRAFGVFRNADNSQLELFEWDPTTVASSAITIISRGLSYSGGTTANAVTAYNWPANSTLVELGSHTPQLFEQYVDKTSDQTIEGLITFTQTPVGLNPGAVPDSSTTVKGIGRISVAPVSSVIPIFVGDNDPRVPTQAENDALVGNNTSIAVSTSNKFMTQTGFQNGAETTATFSGTNTITATYSPIPTALVKGQEFWGVVAVTNTSAVTFNPNSLGAKAVKKLDGATALVAGDLVAGQYVGFKYDGTNMQLMTPPGTLPNTAPTSFNGTFTHDISLTTSTVIAHGLGRVPSYIWLNSLMATGGGGVGFTQSNGSYNGTTQNCIYAAPNSSSNAVAVNVASGKIVHIPLGANPADAAFIEGVCSVDSTNITIAWTKTGSPTGSGTLIVGAI